MNSTTSNGVPAKSDPGEGVKRRDLVLLAVLIFVAGTITPFLDHFVVIEFFYLMIPFVLFTFGSLIYGVASLFNKSLNSRTALYTACVVPLFVISQLISAYTVDKIQRHKSARLIEEIEASIKITGNAPPALDTPIGINYEKPVSHSNFKVSYERGFMVTEVYDGSLRVWKSYGWND